METDTEHVAEKTCVNSSLATFAKLRDTRQVERQLRE